MKKFIALSLLFMALLGVVCSCQDESVSGLENGPRKQLKTGSTNPENPLNPYDLAGKAHSSMLEAFYDTSVLPQNAEQVIARVGLLRTTNYDLMAFDTSCPELVSAARTHYFLDQPQAALADVIRQAAIGERARQSLKNFCDSVLLLCSAEQDYALIYAYIASYENLVLNDVGFSEADKRVLLTSSSIARYAASKKKRPKRNMDTDWELNIFHVAGSIEGQAYAPSEAVTRALCLGIVGNMKKP